MFNTQKVSIIHIPVKPNEDYDILIGELLIRFNELIKIINNYENIQINKKVSRKS